MPTQTQAQIKIHEIKERGGKQEESRMSKSKSSRSQKQKANPILSANINWRRIRVAPPCLMRHPVEIFPAIRVRFSIFPSFPLLSLGSSSSVLLWPFFVCCVAVIQIIRLSVALPLRRTVGGSCVRIPYPSPHLTPPFCPWRIESLSSDLPRKLLAEASPSRKGSTARVHGGVGRSGGRMIAGGAVELRSWARLKCK